MSTLPVTDVFAAGWFSRSCIVGLYTIKPTMHEPCDGS